LLFRISESREIGGGLEKEWVPEKGSKMKKNSPDVWFQLDPFNEIGQNTKHSALV
jgi:hypothetical protein